MVAIEGNARTKQRNNGAEKRVSLKFVLHWKARRAENALTG